LDELEVVEAAARALEEDRTKMRAQVTALESKINAAREVLS
jgi:hypothetical protein